MISPDAVVPTFPLDENSMSVVGQSVPDFANNLMLAVDAAWSNLSTLAKCSSHKDLCAIAGARIAKELHKKGATTGSDAFESFKSLYERFTPSPNTLLEVPLPSVVDIKPLSQSQTVGSNIFSTSNSSSFSHKFETVLKKVHWSPAERTTTSRTAGIQPSSRSSDAKGYIGGARVQTQKRSVSSMVSSESNDPKRQKA